MPANPSDNKLYAQIIIGLGVEERIICKFERMIGYPVPWR